MVWALVVIAIIIVLVLLAIGIIANYDVAANYVSSFLPYFYFLCGSYCVRDIQNLNLWGEDVFGIND